MRAAPAVQVAVDAGRGAACVAVVAGTTAAGCAAWVFQHAEWPGSAFGAVAAAAAIAALAWHRARVLTGCLAWDTAAWHWRDQAGEVRVMIDADAWMLLRFTPAAGGRSRWLPVAAASSRAAWHGLRAAVYCRASTPAR